MFNLPIGSDAVQALVTEALLDQPPETPSNLPRDSSWIRQAFIIPPINISNTAENTLQLSTMDPLDVANGAFSTASIKYTNTSLGGNICINPPPGYTPYADPYDAGIRFDAQEQGSVLPSFKDPGMSPFYSEQLDDHNQVVHMQLGVAQYNSLFQFFTGFYSSELGAAARQGRFSTSYISKFLDLGADAVSFIIAPLVIVPVAVLMFGQAARYFMNWPASSFFNLKPSMEMYWTAVTQLVNQFGANQGIIQYMEPRSTGEFIGDVQSPDNGLLNLFLPDVFSEHGTIDVRAVSNRAKILQMHHENIFKKKLEDATASGQGFDGFVGAVRAAYGTPGASKPMATPPNGTTLEAYLQRFLGFTEWSHVDEDGEKKGKIEEDPRKISEVKKDQTIDQQNSAYGAPSIAKKVGSHFLANAADGAEWVSFRVNHTGTVSESFSNQTAPSAMAQKLNSMSASARDVSNALSGGVVGAAASAVKGFLGSVASNLQLEGLMAAAGSAFVDIPDHWDSSSAQINKSSYSMTLISPYGNPVSMFFNIYVPLAMIMAATLPLATGKQSHTSPFLVRLHDRGRCITRCGIVGDLNIERGVSNTSFDDEGRAMAIKVTFSVKDLSNIVAMPIQPVQRLNPADSLFDGENSFTDYLMALSAVSLRDSYYRIPLLKMNANRTLANLDQYFSASHFGSWLANAPGTGLIRAVMTGALRD